jgi:hypothetical protein
VNEEAIARAELRARDDDDDDDDKDNNNNNNNNGHYEILQAHPSTLIVSPSQYPVTSITGPITKSLDSQQ